VEQLHHGSEILGSVWYNSNFVLMSLTSGPARQNEKKQKSHLSQAATAGGCRPRPHAGGGGGMPHWQPTAEATTHLGDDAGSSVEQEGAPKSELQGRHAASSTNTRSHRRMTSPKNMSGGLGRGRLAGVRRPGGRATRGSWCDNPPRKIPYYRLNQSTLVIKQQ
jgi:hypothetical protein